MAAVRGSPKKRLQIALKITPHPRPVRTPHGAGTNAKINMDNIRVLVACECSGTVRDAFLALGADAYSCDIKPCEKGSSRHYQCDIFEVLDKGWDLLIAHPPCTFISRAGARWMYPKAGKICGQRFAQAQSAKAFFMQLFQYPMIRHICLENPTPLRCLNLPAASQTVQPYEHGHKYSKRTLLWLKNLPKLSPTKKVTGYKPLLPSNTGGAKRGQKSTPVSISKTDSSRTFKGIAEAMAKQWLDYLKNNTQCDLFTCI